MTWSAWAEETFGTPFEIWHDGLDVSRFDDLGPEERATALSLIPEGIDDGDFVAAVGARRLEATDTVPHLEAAIERARGRFLVEVTRALDALGGDATRGRDRIIESLGREPEWSLRIDLAIGLRHLDTPEVRAALLRSVAQDPDYLVRYHAAESLLAIGGIEPLAISDHGELFSHVASDDPERHPEASALLGGMLGLPDER